MTTTDNVDDLEKHQKMFDDALKTLEDKPTGKSKQITITNEQGRLLQLEIDRMVSKAEKELDGWPRQPAGSRDEQASRQEFEMNRAPHSPGAA